MRPILFEIGQLVVPSFWAMAFAGFFAGFLVIRSEAERRGFGRDVTYDVVLHAYVGGWVGARLFMIPTGWDYFSEDPLGFLLSGSGWVWYGGVVGGAAAVAWLARKREIPLGVLADMTAPALALGLGIGRIGCQLSGDGDYGGPTTLPWGMAYPNGVVPTTEIVHPAPVYEMIGCFLIFAVLWMRRTRPLPMGQQLAIYLVASGALRFLIEIVRTNPRWFLGLTTAQAFSVVAIAAGVALLSRLSKTPSVAPASGPVPENPA